MLKNLTRLEVEIAGKIYHLFCDQDAPIADVKNALFKFVKIIGDIEDNAASTSASSASPSTKSENKETEESIQTDVN